MSRAISNRLTEKQYSFVTNYIKNGYNCYQAALSAGYSRNVARFKSHDLINHPAIKQRLEQVDRRLDRRLDMSIDWRLNKLKRLINAIIPDDINEPVNIRHGNIAIAALSEVNKMFGDYAPDKRLSVTVDATREKLNEIKTIYKEY